MWQTNITRNQTKLKQSIDCSLLSSSAGRLGRLKEDAKEVYFRKRFEGRKANCRLSCHLQVEDNVTVVLLSEIVWDLFRPSTGCFEPLILHFPDYSKGRAAPHAGSPTRTSQYQQTASFITKT